MIKAKIVFCKKCQTYLLDHPDKKLKQEGWKKCPNCSWCCDKDGYNLIDKPESKNKDDI
jgi:RNase P subunit RPR2